MSGNSNTIQVELRVNDKGTVTVRQFGKEVERTGDRGEKSFRGMRRTLGDFNREAGVAVAAAGAIGSAFATWQIVSMMNDSLNKFEGFESALTDMGKVTDQALGSIEKRIGGLPPLLGNATELVGGYYQTISAGVTDPVRALETLTGTSRAAKAAHTEQAEVIKVVTKLMAGYQGEIGNVTRATDLLFAIEKEGQTTFRELVPVMGDLGTVSKAVAVSQYEMGGALAVLTQTSASTSEAATKYKSILFSLYKPQEEMRKLMLGMGYASGLSMVQNLGLAGTLQKIQSEAANTNVPLGKLFELQEALIGISALSANGFADFARKTDVMKASVGSTDRAFTAWSETFQATKTNFDNTIHNLMIEFGERLAPTVKGGMNTISGAAASLTGNIDILTDGLVRLGTVVLVGGGLAALPTLITGVVHGVVKAIAFISGGSTMLQAFYGVLLQIGSGLPGIINIVLVLAKALAGLAVALYAGWEIGSWLNNFQTVRLAGIGLVDGLLKGFIYLQHGAEVAWEGMKYAWDRVIGDMKGVFVDFLNLIASGLDYIPGVDWANGLREFAAGIDAGRVGYEDFQATLETLNQELNRELASHDAIIGKMVDTELGIRKLGDATTATVRTTNQSIAESVANAASTIKGASSGAFVENLSIADQIEILKGRFKLEAELNDQTAEFDRRRAAFRQRTEDLRSAYREIHQDLKASDPSGYFETQTKAIGEQARAYRRLKIDAKTVLDWQTNALKELNREIVQTTGSITDGMALAFRESAEEAIRFGQIGYDAVEQFATDSKSAMSDLFFDGFKGELKSFEDYWDRLWDGMVRTATDALAEIGYQKIVLPAVTGLFGGAGGQSLMGMTGTGGNGLSGVLSRPIYGQAGSGAVFESAADPNFMGPPQAGMSIGEGLGTVGALAMGTVSAINAWENGRKSEAIGTGVGMAMGAALFTWGGPLGIAIGGMIGSTIGGFLEKKHVTDDIDSYLAFNAGAPDTDFKPKEMISSNGMLYTTTDYKQTWEVGPDSLVYGKDELIARRDAEYGMTAVEKDWNKQGKGGQGNLINLELTDFFKRKFHDLDDAFNLSVGEIIKSDDAWMIHLENSAQILADSGLEGLIEAYASEFFIHYGDAFAEAVKNQGLLDIFTVEKQDLLYERLSAGNVDGALEEIRTATDALAAVQETLSDAPLTDYSRGIAEINRRYEEQTATLSGLGVDLEKYTDLEKARLTELTAETFQTTPSGIADNLIGRMFDATNAHETGRQFGLWMAEAMTSDLTSSLINIITSSFMQATIQPNMMRMTEIIQGIDTSGMTVEEMTQAYSAALKSSEIQGLLEESKAQSTAFGEMISTLFHIERNTESLKTGTFYEVPGTSGYTITPGNQALYNPASFNTPVDLMPYGAASMNTIATNYEFGNLLRTLTPTAIASYLNPETASESDRIDQLFNPLIDNIETAIRGGKSITEDLASRGTTGETYYRVLTETAKLESALNDVYVERDRRLTELMQKPDVLEGIAVSIAKTTGAFTELEIRTCEMNREFDDYIKNAKQTGAREFELAWIEEQRAVAIGQLLDAEAKALEADRQAVVSSQYKLLGLVDENAWKQQIADQYGLQVTNFTPENLTEWLSWFIDPGNVELIRAMGDAGELLGDNLYSLASDILDGEKAAQGAVEGLNASMRSYLQTADSDRLAEITTKYGLGSFGKTEIDELANVAANATQSELQNLVDQFGITGLTVGTLCTDIADLVNAFNTLDQAAEQQRSSIDAKILDLKYSQYNLASPGQIQREAELDYRTLLAEARPEDSDSVNRYLAQVDTYLEKSLETNKGQAFVDIYNSVLTDLNNLGAEMSDVGKTPEVYQLESLNDYSSQSLRQLETLNGTMSTWGTDVVAAIDRISTIGTIPDLPGYADGGISYTPQVAWVSEKYIEAHIPMPGGKLPLDLTVRGNPEEGGGRSRSDETDREILELLREIASKSGGITVYVGNELLDDRTYEIAYGAADANRVKADRNNRFRKRTV